MKAQIQKKGIKSFLQDNVILLFLLLLCVFFAVSSDKFLTANNLFLVIRQVSVLGAVSYTHLRGAAAISHQPMAL